MPIEETLGPVCYVVARDSVTIAVFSTEEAAQEFVDAQADAMKENPHLWSIDTKPFNPGHW